MNKEEWLKAINLTKEQLIEWLNEMYEDDKRLKEIIRKYEINYDVSIKNEQYAVYNPTTMKQELHFYTKVKANGFEYKRNWC